MSPGGACTHWKAPPLHGARRLLTFNEADFRRFDSLIDIVMP